RAGVFALAAVFRIARHVGAAAVARLLVARAAGVGDAHAVGTHLALRARVAAPAAIVHARREIDARAAAIGRPVVTPHRQIAGVPEVVRAEPEIAVRRAPEIDR